MKLSRSWVALGISEDELDEKADWMSRELLGLPGAADMYFRTAGSLLRFSKVDYSLLPLCFFQAVIGLEKVLRIRYDKKKRAFKKLLLRAVSDGAISDESISILKPLVKIQPKRLAPIDTTSAKAFATRIPKLRNDFFHGNYTLHPHYLHLAIRVRKAVDAVLANRANQR